MATLQTLYNNIKTFVHQKFEYKTEEDETLPAHVENLFGLENGQLFIYPITADFTKWSGTEPIYSDFVLPDNHEITITFKSTPNVQIACSDTSNNWIYAQNIGYSNNDTFSYRNSSNSTFNKSLSVTRDTDSVYKIICNQNVIQYYVNNTLIHSTSTYDPLNIIRKIRIYANANSIDTLTVRQVQ